MLKERLKETEVLQITDPIVRLIADKFYVARYSQNTLRFHCDPGWEDLAEARITVEVLRQLLIDSGNHRLITAIEDLVRQRETAETIRRLQD